MLKYWLLISLETVNQIVYVGTFEECQHVYKAEWSSHPAQILSVHDSRPDNLWEYHTEYGWVFVTGEVIKKL